MFNTGISPKSEVSVSPLGSLLSLAFLIVALTSSLFFQKVNAEYFALAGLSLIASFSLALWFGRLPALGRYGLPLALLFAFWAWVGLATALSPVTFISLGTFWTVAFFPFAALTVILVAGFHKFETIAISALMAVVAALAIYACVRFLLFDEAPRATFANKNNLAALQMPMALYSAACAVTSQRFLSKMLFFALTALFVFTIGVIGSRGVLICLLAGFALIVGVLFLDKWPRRTLAALLATFAFSLVASNHLGSENLANQAETMLAPSSAGNDRFIIWQGSMELAEATPWHGIGPGLFQMVYPQYRLDEDGSAAFFVHNDYLQFFIEAGWPAPFLILASLIVLATQGFRKVLGSHTAPEQRLALLTPLLGVGAIAGHSLLSFNLFLPPLLIMCGILFGLTTHHLTRLETATPRARLKTKPTFISVTAVALSVVPTMYFIDIARSTLLHKQSMVYYEKGDFPSSLTALEQAAKISPGADIYHYSQAGIWLQKVAKEAQTPIQKEVSKALALLDRAEELNPLRPQINVIRARIIQNTGHPELQNPTDNLEKLTQMVETEYRQALKKDPFHLDARFYLARFMLQQNRLAEGQAVLENGLGKPYPYSRLSVNYYRLTAEMRRILGDQEGYQDLITRLRETVSRKKTKIPEQSSPPEPGF